MSSVETVPLAPAAEKLRERFARSPLSERVAVVDLDLPTLEVAPADWPAVARFLRDDSECAYDLFLDLAGVDNAKRRGRPTRFEAVYHLHSLPRSEHVRVKVILPDTAEPRLPSVVDVWPAANWFEREAFDLYGFDFPGHPNLRRILVHDAFVQAWRKWSTLRDPALFERWFDRILVNTCRNRLDRASRWHLTDISAEVVFGSPDAISDAHDRDVIGKAIATLTPDHRVVVALRYYRDLTVEEIANRLEIPVGTVQSRLHYALKRLHAVIDRHAHGSAATTVAATTTMTPTPASSSVGRPVEGIPAPPARPSTRMITLPSRPSLRRS